MKHIQNLKAGYYQPKKVIHKVIVDKYSGNNYRVVKVYEEGMQYLIGRTLSRGHGFRLALKKELDQFE